MRLGRWLLLTVVLALAGCSTVETRIRDNPNAYAALSPSDQQLVRSGQIRQGMPQAAVYLAWGRPDHVRSGVRQGVPFEAWIYTQLRDVYAPGFYPQFAWFGPYRYAGFWGPGWGGGWWGGGPFWGDPFFANFATVEVPYKTAFFERGQTTGWEFIR
jgi:hypothetical protein